eukprot:CAMPEP_0119552596 /NCGR_PEP_ID=MMETSP1352-20130426/5536_1 /TAXON_ID=265584 /ORGANISM="Stauroneis constricta, Strain CCMP1120" /LENGTH=82 /DNA_ID=CAMNT_0007598849 /DNA_START=449 /DNA_END=696 /DNA_ORIENTATION=+
MADEFWERWLLLCIATAAGWLVFVRRDAQVLTILNFGVGIPSVGKRSNGNGNSLNPMVAAAVHERNMPNGWMGDDENGRKQK